VVDDLIHRQRHEVRDLELDDGPAPHERAPDAAAGDRGLRDRRVDDASAPEALQEAGRHLEEATHPADVLADDERGRIALHLLPKRLVQRLAHRQLPLAQDNRPAAVHSLGA
jgi:hypothetical protein